MNKFDQFLSVWNRPGLQFKRIKSPTQIRTENFVIYVSAVDGLAHEIAHMIQMKKSEYKRIMKRGNMEFKLPRIWVYDRFCIDVQTTKVSMRELETFAIQYHLLNQIWPMTIDAYIKKYRIGKLIGWLPDTALLCRGGEYADDYNDVIAKHIHHFVGKHTPSSISKKWFSMDILI